jgi:hypothetical protein
MHTHTQSYRQLGILLTGTFQLSARKPAHNNGCGRLQKKYGHPCSKRITNIITISPCGYNEAKQLE